MIYRVFSDAITLGCDNILLVEDYGIGHFIYTDAEQWPLCNEYYFVSTHEGVQVTVVRASQ